MMLARNCTGTTTAVNPCLRSSRRMCCSMGSPMIGSIGLGWLLVRGRRRVPWPPAITTAFTQVILDGCLSPPLSGAACLDGSRAKEPSDVADVESGGPVVLDDADGEEDPADRLHRGREGKSEVPPGDHRNRAHEDERADLADVADVETAGPRTEECRPDDDHPDVADEDEQRGPPREGVTNDERHDRRRDGETVGRGIGDLAEPRHA